MTNDNLQIKMFGSFSIINNEKNILENCASKNKVLYFLEYLISNHHRSVPQEELVDILLANDDCIDPINTLKNLAYRSRQILKNAGLAEKEYIYCSKGAYGFSQNTNCTVDVEEFEKSINLISNTNDKKKILSAALNAIKIYDGDFLPFSYGQNWVIPLSVKYQDMFIMAVRTASLLLMEKDNKELLLSILEKGISLYPYNEDFHIIRITALYNMGKIKNAISEYETVSIMLFDELGVNPSDELQAIYFKSLKAMGNLTLSMQDALNEIMDTPTITGSFYCNYQMFSNTCRFLRRHIARNGISAFLVLCSITHKNSDVQVSADELKKASESFHKSICSALRQNDIYTRCSPSQFLVLLLGSNQENTKEAMNRVNAAFKKNYRNKEIILSFQYTSLVDLSQYNLENNNQWKANNQ